MDQEKEQIDQRKKTAEKTSVKKPVSAVKNAAVKERDWADRTEETPAEPYVETYRDGSTKNECW